MGLTRLGNHGFGAILWGLFGYLIYENTWNSAAIYGLGFLCGILGGVLLGGLLEEPKCFFVDPNTKFLGIEKTEDAQNCKK